jgi:CheY-like chemotaxis protein
MQTHTVDLIVLDMVMLPGIDGLETYRQHLRKTSPPKSHH